MASWIVSADVLVIIGAKKSDLLMRCVTRRKDIVCCRFELMLWGDLKPRSKILNGWRLVGIDDLDEGLRRKRPQRRQLSL